MKKIMIVEDEIIIRDELKGLLNNNGFETSYVEDFKKTEQEILKYCPNLVLLDINIPYLNGEQILQSIRKKSNVPIIMLTSKTNEIDEVLSMSYGADDYITKPYNPTLLILKINAILKRTTNTLNSVYYNDIEVLSNRGVLKKQNNEINLTKNEMIIFNCLLNNKGRIVSRDEIMTIFSLYNNSVTISI